MSRKNKKIESGPSLPSKNPWASFLKKFIAAGIFFILFLPIVGDYGDYLYPVGRELMFRGVTEIMFAAYVFLVILDRRFLPKLSPLFFAIAGFLVISGLAVVFSLQPKLSFWGDFYRGLGFFTLTHYLVFFVILTRVIRTWREWKRFIYFAIFVSVPVVLTAIILRFSQEGRALSTLNNPVFLGAYLNLVFFLTFIFGYLTKNKALKIFFFILASLQIAVLLITFSRGALAGLLAGIFAIFILSPPSIKRKKIWLTSLLVGVLIINGIFYGANVFQIEKFAVLLQKTPFLNRILTNPADLFEGRSQSWIIGISAIKEKPILGFGQDDFNIPYDKYYKPELGELDLFGSWFDRAHNFILEMGATTGSLGLASYLVIWVVSFWLLSRKRNAAAAELKTPPKYESIVDPADNYTLLKLGLTATFVAYLIQNLFNLDTIISYIYIFFLLAFLNFLTVPETELKNQSGTMEQKNIQQKNRGKNYLLLSAAVILIPLLLFSLKKYHYAFWTDSIAHNRAETLIGQLEYEKALPIYENALNDDWSYLHHTLRHKYASALISYAQKFKGTQPEKTKELAKKALEEIDTNNAQERYYFNRSWLLGGVIANTLVELGETNAAEKADYYFGKALEMSPGRPGLWVEWAKTDLMTGRYASAEEKLKKAAELNPRLVEPYFYRGVAALYEKNYTDAEKFFGLSRRTFVENGYSGYDPTSNEALQEKGKAYFEIHDFPKLAQTYTKLLQRNPQNLQLWISLAVVYKEMGQKEKARQTLEETAKIFPGLMQNPTVQEFLKNL